MRARPLAGAAVALLLLPWATGAVPLVRFVRERIELRVRGDALVVEGRYVYENPLPFPVTQGLDVPFATDDGQVAPATIEAWTATQEFVLGPDGTTFTLRMWPASLPPWPYRLLVSEASFYADQTGQLRAIRVNEPGVRCPADAPVVATIEPAR